MKEKLIHLSLVASAVVLGIWSVPGADAQERSDLPDTEAMAAQAAEVLEALEAFLNAETREEAARYILDAEALKPLLDAHYERFPYQKPVVEGVRHVGGSQVKSLEVYFTHEFGIKLKGRDKEIPVTMVQMGDDFLLDWELYAQFVDNTFENFLEQKPDEPQTFRLSMTRAVPVGAEEELPLEGDVMRFRLRWRPGIDETEDAFVGSGTEAGEAAKETGSYRAYRPYRVTLKWNKSEPDMPFLEIESMELINFDTPSVVNSEE